jgi:hypothetical protein
MDEWESADDRFGLWDGECRGCDIYGRVDDLGLCEECASKLERDLIRERSWDHSAAAYALPPDRREALREEVVRHHGPEFELIAESGQSRAARRRKRRRKSRK